MPKLRTFDPYDCARIETAIQHLRQARDLLARSRTTRTAPKVRKALKSAEGALRHADRLRFHCPV